VVNINTAILDMYLQDLLPEISVPGDDHNYGSSAMNDVTALQVWRVKQPAAAAACGRQPS
jgi:hypothetical protein